MSKDRNFDDLAERFQHKVYGGLKGEVRLAVLWRDLEQCVPELHSGRQLRILDVGAGLGQLAIRLAKLGHQVVVNDLSEQMLAMAKTAAESEGVLDKIQWYHCPLQALPQSIDDRFDLVMCHAVVEWLEDPEPLLPLLTGFLLDDGLLSLTYYNRHSLEYRNLIRGNFNLLKREQFVPDPGSLTPGNPLYPELVESWVNASGLKAKSKSGIRVFHDYVTTQRGGHAIANEVIDMELRYSQREPYLWLGRYIHLMLEHAA
jgi:S-adenosylmethionine-dependent methyltransferase